MYWMSKAAFLIALALCSTVVSAGAAEVKPELRIQPADHAKGGSRSAMMGGAMAGHRIVAVGDHGVVLLSDDGGKTYRQAKSVPVSSTLTSVSFADALHGWAVGHWGVILTTSDGGETWKIQRSDLHADQPLLSVYFKDSHEGWAVGLWSLLLHTTDGGATWVNVKLMPPPGSKEADRNLYSIFAAPDHGRMYIVSEHGLVLTSTDGVDWEYQDTGYKGSLWAGTVLSDGVVLVGGLRGTVLRSSDHGKTWQEVKSGTTSSITGLAQLKDKSIAASALDGVVAKSTDGGVTFEAARAVEGLPNTAVVALDTGGAVLLSLGGPVLRKH